LVLSLSLSLSLSLKCEIYLKFLFRGFPIERLLQAGVVVVVVAIIHKPGAGLTQKNNNAEMAET
jgi:hypothetical protein